MAEFADVCKWYENRIKTLYGAEKFNYCAIMMREHFVHFNVYPRYSTPINKYGMQFIDEGWPKKVIENKIEIAQEVQNQIILDLKD